MSVGGRELRYFLYQAAIVSIIGAPVALFCLLLGWEPVLNAAFSFVHGGALNGRALLLVVGGVTLLLPLIVLSFRIDARLILALAAVAIDDSPGRLLREAWRHTKGNARALFYGWLACIVPVSLLWAIASLFLNHALGVHGRPDRRGAGLSLLFRRPRPHRRLLLLRPLAIRRRRGGTGAGAVVVSARPSAGERANSAFAHRFQFSRARILI